MSKMLVVGLTGSIGMGKSTAAEMFRTLKTPVYDADAEVHKLYAEGGAAVEPIRAEFPTAVERNKVIRARLSKLVVGNEAEIKKLEAITHPLLGQGRADFFAAAEKAGAKLVVLDVPLIFETGGEKRFDKIVVVSAPKEVQRERVLARDDMTEEKFEAILARQTPDAEKRRQADYVINTNCPKEATLEQIRGLLEDLKHA
ncbi:MAG: dephospho-CoA kinase [Sneathiella sp.]|uniref:dephospho-CoA kinase n=1 Tax=Sneathiella sp. TaxID=1964365 RepID=UPI003002703D